MELFQGMSVRLVIVAMSSWGPDIGVCIDGTLGQFGAQGSHVPLAFSSQHRSFRSGEHARYKHIYLFAY